MSQGRGWRRRSNEPDKRKPDWLAARWRIVAASALLFAGANAAFSAPKDTKYDKSCTAAECHPMPENDRLTIAHPPYFEEWCQTCHADHASNKEGLLLDKQPELCISCHTSIETGTDPASHAMSGQKCTDCHDPHQSRVRHLLRKEAMLLACSQCHADDLKQAGDLPYRHKYFSPEKECGSCHYAHQNSAGKFLKPNVGESCLTCHDMTIKVDDGVLENVGKEIRESSFVHGPVKSEACPTCHTPHGSVQPALLKEGYPAGSYDEYSTGNYSLCWQCHDASLVESGPTRTATNFRDGDQNLHQVHVMNLKRSRACHLCHTAHAAERPHLLRDSITFNKWEGVLDWKGTDQGGSCSIPCHRPKEYNRSAQ